jgi:hypothetical protein
VAGEREANEVIIDRCHLCDALQVPLGSQDAINRKSTVVGMGSGTSQAAKRAGEAKEEGQTQVCADARLGTCAYPSPADTLIPVFFSQASAVRSGAASAKPGSSRTFPTVNPFIPPALMVSA